MSESLEYTDCAWQCPHCTLTITCDCDDPELPDGWQRVNVWTGIGRNTDQPVCGECFVREGYEEAGDE